MAFPSRRSLVKFDLTKYVIFSYWPYVGSPNSPYAYKSSRSRCRLLCPYWPYYCWQHLCLLCSHLPRCSRTLHLICRANCPLLATQAARPATRNMAHSISAGSAFQSTYSPSATAFSSSSSFRSPPFYLSLQQILTMLVQLCSPS